jgi:hypothetical protein
MVAGKRTVGDDVEIDHAWQYFQERPYGDPDGETVDVIDDRPVGETTTENVPAPTGESPETSGQTTLEEWGWSR